MIKKPEEMNFSEKNIVMIIAGLPGVGKTSVALSAPDVLIVDADEGLARVKPEHRKDASLSKTYEEVLSDIKEAEGVYKTIVLDTGGAFIEMLKDWAIRTEPSASKKSGGISQQGYGFVKTEFLRLFAEIRKKFNVILLFHAAKDKVDDGIFYDIICEGSAKNLVWQPADIGGYMFIQNGERYLGFTPTEQYNAKSAYGIKGLVKVPELKDGEPNVFLSQLFVKIRENLANETAELKPQTEAYNRAMNFIDTALSHLEKPEDALDCLAGIRGYAEHALTSLKEGEDKFKKLVKEKGWSYNKNAKAYIAKAE